jgi:hypothetical protein
MATAKTGTKEAQPSGVLVTAACRGDPDDPGSRVAGMMNGHLDRISTEFPRVALDGTPLVGIFTLSRFEVSMSEFKTERRIFQENLEEWRRAQLGRFVLIKGEDVIGFFPTLREAFDRGTALFGLEPFLVQQIAPSEKVNVSFFGARILST